MPKIKTHKGASKRFKKTASGKFKRNKAKHGHLFECKSKKLKRELSGSAIVDKSNENAVKKMLPYA